MSSPFPGMDPYLESHWGDVHQAFITYLRDSLQPQLPVHLRARMQVRVYIELPEGLRREYFPDVRVLENPRPGASKAVGVAEEPAGVAVAEPLWIDLDVEPRTESFLEVIDVRSGNRVISSIELISPGNKRSGEGRDLYLQKRQDMMRGGVNTIEIDLLRGGNSLLPMNPDRLPPAYETRYLAWTWRPTDPRRLAVYRMPLREPLPVIPIPLGPTDSDAIVNLQAILDQCYRNGGYDDIDYRVPPSPALDDDDSAWADALLRAHGLR